MTRTPGRLLNRILILTLVAGLIGCAPTLLHPGEQRSVLAPQARGYPYLLFVPARSAVTRNAKPPLLIFLHGSGERGADIDKVKVHGPPRLVETRSDFPFVTLSPLLEADGDWEVQKLDAMLRQVRHKVRFDPTRVYLTGLSRGAHGTWRWGTAEPGLFAAIAPVSGRGDPSQACSLRDLPVWAFHGDSDTVVDPVGSTAMVNAVNACGGHALITLYPMTGHDAWTRTYDNPELFSWFLSHQRKGVARGHRNVETGP